MSEVTIYAVIVIYNKSCDESLTCQCFKHIQNVRLILVDNSTKEYPNEHLAADFAWRYISMGGNKGLEKAYNRAIEAVDDQAAMICLFDDDSEINQEYFDCLKTAAMNEPDTQVFLPLVYDNDGLMSPNIFDEVSVIRADKVEDL
jgi:GT2 family glycosyltransferase